VALLGDAAHLMLQYLAQGAAMAYEDAISLAAQCDAADGDFAHAFLEYQKQRLVRASRVQMSASLIGIMFHAPDGVPRLVRNEIYRGRTAAQHFDALDWIFSAPDYVRHFAKKPGKTATRRARRKP
jgi:salicylate hydroxylase